MTHKYTARTPAGLRETLFETMDSYLDGKIQNAKARVVCDIARQIIETGRLELHLVQAAKTGLELATAMEDSQRLLGSGDILDEEGMETGSGAGHEHAENDQ